MNKTLRNLALVAVAALPVAAYAQLNVETLMLNGVVDGVANPIEGLDGGWGKPTATNPGTATVSRFATGLNGKIYTTNHKENSIVCWDGEKLTTVATLPAVTVEKWENNVATPADALWNGTAISADDKGNLVINFCFINADLSLQNWGVITPDGKVTQVKLSTPLSELGTHGRLDQISQIVGDVTSEEGGIGYATTAASANVIMFHFKGDGTKVTSVTAKASAPIEELAKATDVQTMGPAPKYATVAELLNGTPENNFYMPLGAKGPSTVNTVPSVTAGTVYTFEGSELTTLEGLGNRGYNNIAVLRLAGNEYFVRQFIDENLAATISSYRNVMAVGIFTKEGVLVEKWEGSTYANGFGMCSMNVQAIDDKSAYVYVYVATGSKDQDDTTGTIPGCYAAVLKVTDNTHKLEGSGTATDPYQIATAEDLCYAYKLTKAGEMVYFVQTADIDMSGVTDWHALVGFDNVTYSSQINYDGQNHLIKNFTSPNEAFVAGKDNCYNGSIFGVMNGVVRNLGIVDCNINTPQGGGAVAGYGGHGTGTSGTIENVFVTGTIKGTNYLGGLVGTNGNAIIIRNCFVNATIESTGCVAGIVGRLRSFEDNYFGNVYAAGTVTGASGALFVSSDKTDVVAEGSNLIAFNTGVANATIGTEDLNVDVATDADRDILIADVKDWTAFSDTKTVGGLPALASFDYGETSGLFDAAVDAADAPAVYYNLQGVQVANPDNGIYIVRRGSKVAKELIRK